VVERGGGEGVERVGGCVADLSGEDFFLGLWRALVWGSWCMCVEWSNGVRVGGVCGGVVGSGEREWRRAMGCGVLCFMICN